MAEKLTKEAFIEAIKEMTVLELNDLVKALEEEFDVKASAPMMMAAAPAAAASADDAEEKSDFDIYIKNPGEKKIQVIKVVRGITNAGLKEAKEMVEDAEKPIQTNVPKADAEKVKKELEEAGAVVELK